MLKLKNLKEGDYVIAEYEGQNIEGVVRSLHRDDENEICVETDVQEFWFKPEDLTGIPLTEEQLFKFGFLKQENDDGSVKYMKGPFRLVTPIKGEFSLMEIWYREDRRHITAPIFVHELQHHYHDMTKVHLVRGAKVRESL